MGRKTKADKSEELLLGFLSDLEEEVSDGQNVSGLFSDPPSDRHTESSDFKVHPVEATESLEKERIFSKKESLKKEASKKVKRTKIVESPSKTKMAQGNFFERLIEADLSNSERKIVKFLYEKDNSLSNIVASRREIQTNTGVSATGFVRSLNSLKEKGILVHKKINKDGTKVQVNSFSVVL